MAMEKTTEAIDFESMYWKKARANFKQARSSDKDDAKKLDAFLKEWATPQDTRDLCKSVQKAAADEYSPSLGGILENIEIAMSVGDLAIKAAPESVGLAWMGIRLCLRCVADDFATFNIFGAACSDIIGILISCGVFARMYSTSRGLESFDEIHAQVTDRIPVIYQEILDFSFSVKKHLNRPKTWRIVKGIVAFRQASEKYGAKIKSIKSHDQVMAEYARRAHEQLADHYLRTGLNTQEDMVISLDDIRSKLDHSAKIAQDQSQQIRILVEELTKRRELTPQEVARKNFDENVKKLNATSDQQSTYEAKLKRRSPPKTCTWIFEHEVFKNWFDSPSSSMLWVSGGGGFGKSILMAAVVNELQLRSVEEEAIVQYFFCNAGDDATKRTERVLGHLLNQVYQLVSQHPTETIEKSNKLVSNYLKGTKDTKATQDGKTEDVTFADAFRGIVNLLGKPAYIMVDALDECTDRPKGLLRSLRELTIEPQANIKVILCSRPDPMDIVNSMDKTPVIKVEGNNAPDIKLNANAELEKLPGWTASEREVATDMIVHKAGSYFRYVELAVGFLKQPWQRPLKKHLERLPEGLPAFYEQIIKKTDPAYVDLLKTCLTWTILAEGQVHVTEIVDAYSRLYATEDELAQELQTDGLEEDSPYAIDAETESDRLYVNQIRTAGSSLLEVDSESGVIQLRHNTVADHLLNKETHASQGAQVDPTPVRCESCRKVQPPTYSFTVSEKEGHLSIASTILRHLMNKNFRQKYLVPHERVEETNRQEDRADNLRADEMPIIEENTEGGKNIASDSDVAPDTATAANSNVAPDTAIATNSDVVADTATPPPEEIPRVTAVNDNDQDQPASNNVTSSEGPPIRDESEPESPMVKPSLDNAASDAASETDSDAASEEAENLYRGFGDDNSDEAYRYEVNYCGYHLKRVEELYGQDDRTGSEWAEFERLRAAFFRDDSPYFRSWVNLLSQGRHDVYCWTDFRTIHPIHVAALHGLTSLVKKLIVDGIDLTQSTNIGDDPLILALQYYRSTQGDEKSYNNSINLLEVLLESGADVNAINAVSSEPAFFRLFYYNPTLEVVQLFLSHAADLSVTDDWNFTILHLFCAICDKADVLEELLNHGAQLDALDQSQRTPLHSILSRFSEVPLELLKILIRAGANVNSEDDYSRQPLRLLCETSGSYEAAKILVDANADIFDEDLSQKTALHVAAENGHADIVKLLISKGAKTDVTDKKGCTPLYKACGAKNDASALYMISQFGETLTKPAKNGKTPLWKAAARGHQKIVEAIFETCHKNIDVLDTKDAKDRTPLHGAAQNGRKAVVEYMIGQNVQANVRDKYGKTPLRACFEGWRESKSLDYEAICIMLLDAGGLTELDVDLLHVAAAQGSLPVLQKLMDNGADPLVQDEHGWTPIQIAQHYHHDRATEVLSTRKTKSGLQPSQLVNTLPKLLKVSEDNLEVQSLSAYNGFMPAVSILAQHPVTAGALSFYFEIEVEASSREDNLIGEPSVGLGLCVYPTKSLRHWFPGWAWNINSWAYHGDDGWLASCPAKPFSVLVRYGHGDKVGCGLDVHQEIMFFTKNGELLDVERNSKTTHHAHADVRGRLYPVIGLQTPGVKVKVNFGSDPVSRPFVWGPGNEADHGIAVVAESEKAMARRPLRRRTTGALSTLQTIRSAKDVEDTTAGAEAPSKADAPAS